jgi:DNA-binding IclR family transcriptional regulator
VLLAADKPLGRSEIIDRAGISGSTYDRRISALDGFDFAERDTDTKWTIQLSQWFVREGSRSHPDLEAISQGGLKSILRDVLNPAELTEEVSTALGSLN